MSEAADELSPDMESIEACEGILAILGASQRQLRYLAHQHLSFAQVLAVEEDIRVGGSPERAEIQRFRMLLDARLDHVRQLRTLVSAAPLVETLDSNSDTAERLKEALSTVERPRVSYNFSPSAADILTEVPVARTLEGLDTSLPVAVASSADSYELPEISDELDREVTIETSLQSDKSDTSPKSDLVAEEANLPPEHTADSADPTLDLPDSIEFELFEDEPTVEAETATNPYVNEVKEEVRIFKMPPLTEAKPIQPVVLALGGDPAADTADETAEGSETFETPTEPPVPAPFKSHEPQVEPTFEAAISAYKRGDTARAANIYTALIEDDSSHPPLLLARGRCYLDLGDWSSAMSDFRKAEALSPDSPDPLVAMGDLFLARHDYERAIQRFDSAIELDEAHAIARSRRGVSHYYTHSYRQAFLDLQKAYHLDPELPNIRQLVQMAIRKIENLQ
jgi:tetratricopeptide (TPR) repeat protein